MRASASTCLDMNPVDFRFWHISDIHDQRVDVRCSVESGHRKIVVCDFTPKVVLGGTPSARAQHRRRSLSIDRHILIFNGLEGDRRSEETAGEGGDPRGVAGAQVQKSLGLCPRVRRNM